MSRGTIMLILCLFISAFIIAPAMAASEGTLTYGESAERTATLYNTGNIPIALQGTATPWSPSKPGYDPIAAETLQARGASTAWVIMNGGVTVDTLAIGGASPPDSAPIVFKEEIPNNINLGPATTYTTTITITGSRT